MKRGWRGQIGASDGLTNVWYEWCTEQGNTLSASYWVVGRSFWSFGSPDGVVML